ncbi:MAG: tetratricopeptide repeat protein [Pirellula sp.]
MDSIVTVLVKGLNHHRMGQLGAAEQAYRQVLKSDPRNSKALYYLGVLASQVGNKTAAVDLISQAIAIDPTQAVYFYNLGEALQVLGRFDEAIQAYLSALRIDPNDADSMHNQGRAWQSLGRTTEAIACYQQTLKIRPRDFEAMNNLGGALQATGNYQAAIACYQSALQIQPNYVQVVCNLGSALKASGQPEQARDCYRHALSMQPQSIEAMNGLVGQLQEMCSWPNYESLSHRLVEAIDLAIRSKQNHLISPLSYLGLPTVTTPRQQLEFCLDFCSRKLTSVVGAKRPFQFHRTTKPRLRIGYLSGDLQTHPVALCVCELFENHDRDRFEIIAYSFGADDQSPTRRRIANACDQFLDIREESFEASAARIHSDQIDILVDLMGHTYNARTEIVAMRPAPIQIQFLGFAGTMGLPTIDYLVADTFVIPNEHLTNYSEKIIRMPHCFFPNDTKRAWDLKTNRADHGLPEEAVVLCSFNNTTKITPVMFDLWMRVLKSVPNAVLWIYVQNDIAANNLRSEAVARGVGADRMVFARRLPNLDDHMARYSLADLFLDTFPYNAHSTSSDALWMGCPVITKSGQTFASRIAGSVLRAVQLEQLITTTTDDYERLAIELASDRSKLQALRSHLEANRFSLPLFQSQEYAKNMEAGFETVWQRWLAGLAPDHINIA